MSATGGGTAGDSAAGDRTAGPTGRRYAAVLGRPIGHSLSPLLHNAAYTAIGLPWDYRAIDCGLGELAARLARTGPDCAGFSVTMPLKREALEVAADILPRAIAVGAVNTLLPADAGWRATNTDVDGIIGALFARGVRPHRVCVLGAGGTAQAAVVALAELGLSECVVLVRDPGRAAELRATATRAGVSLAIDVLVPAHPELRADLVISTLPAGAADALAGFEWRSEQTVLDVAYHPWPSALARAADDAGAVVVSGASMLLHQAAAQVELMTGRPAPLEAMRDALRSVRKL